jgi:hypothetical protein
MTRYGIYGYECTREVHLPGFNIIPMSNDHSIIENLSSNLDVYHLTSFLEIDGDDIEKNRELIFDLEGIISFIDQKDIIIQNKLRNDEAYDRLGEDYPKIITGHKRINGGGKVIVSDAVSNDSRSNFIEMALNKLNDKVDPNNDVFRKAFFKSIEVFRGTINYIDVGYYLLFSALESLSRSVTSDYESRNCSEPIATYLSPYNFDLTQDNPMELHKAISTYVHLRNALFHNGKLEKEVDYNGNLVTLKLSKYYSYFNMLLPLVLMKHIEFDDGHINWNSWIDGMPFI